jgi:hypothetical protein
VGECCGVGWGGEYAAADIKWVDWIQGGGSEV